VVTSNCHLRPTGLQESIFLEDQIGVEALFQAVVAFGAPAGVLVVEAGEDEAEAADPTKGGTGLGGELVASDAVARRSAGEAGAEFTNRILLIINNIN